MTSNDSSPATTDTRSPLRRLFSSRSFMALVISNALGFTGEQMRLAAQSWWILEQGRFQAGDGCRCRAPGDPNIDNYPVRRRTNRSSWWQANSDHRTHVFDTSCRTNRTDPAVRSGGDLACDSPVDSRRIDHRSRHSGDADTCCRCRVGRSSTIG